jgi:DNA/RNA-binding domain of Phe-tRNA-synthetase-like protein
MKFNPTVSKEMWMRFEIEAEVFELFPQFCRGLVVATGIDNMGQNLEIEAMLKECEQRVLQDPAIDVANHPRILACKEAYRKFGANPNKFTPSILFLAKQVKAGKPVRSISPAVDAFNVISLKYLIPCGGDDIDAVNGDMTLGRAISDETFAPLFKPEEIEHPEVGEVIYVNRSSKRVMCRRWNWRNADFSKLTPSTRNVAINVDGMMPAISRAEIEQAAEELGQLILRYCGGKVAVRFLDAQSRKVELAGS